MILLDSLTPRFGITTCSAQGYLDLKMFVGMA